MMKEITEAEREEMVRHSELESYRSSLQLANESYATLMAEHQASLLKLDALRAGIQRLIDSDLMPMDEDLAALLEQSK